MSNILDEPIDWARDERLKEVPLNASINENIIQRWGRINAVVFDGTPVDHDIQSAEEALLRRKNDIGTGTLSSEFDWKHDLELARYTHRFHVSSLDSVRGKRTSYLKFWEEWTKQATDYYRDVSLNGQKTIYLLHGAVALGALNILAQPSKSSLLIVLTAKWALAFSVLGIVFAGLGQLISFHYMSLIANRIKAKISIAVRWSKARALSRYIRRYGAYIELGDKFIYASIFWFGAYVAILLIMLSNT